MGRLQPRPEDVSSTAGSSGAAQPGAAIPRRDPVVVVGTGPAGLFAALALAEAGIQASICSSLDLAEASRHSADLRAAKRQAKLRADAGV